MTESVKQSDNKIVVDTHGVGAFVGASVGNIVGYLESDTFAHARNKTSARVSFAR
jgi:hypothetical protein